jgi:hypothetical protein
MGSIFGGRFPLDDEASVPFTERFAFALRLSVAEAKQERMGMGDQRGLGRVGESE